MLVYGDTQDHFGAILVDNELIQVLSQRLGRYMTATHVGCAAQWATSWLLSLIETREALAAEVGAVVCALGGTSGMECAAADGA